MNKLEVGMYVRTRTGKIGIVQNFKFLNKEDEEKIVMVQFQDDFTPSIVDKIRILKASHNIIDLIEDGDYVNGYKIVYIRGIKHIITENGVEFFGIFHINDIKSIVTKEQFSSMEYRLGE